MPNGTYTWLSLSDAISQLGQRLNITPSTTSFWTIAELQTYIATALRQYNSLVWQWRQDFQFQSTTLWNSLGSLPGSPRLRTLYDTDAYTELEYMLLEPATGQTWTGTNQFQISDLSQALQRRRDEMIQIGNLNQVLVTGIPLTPNTIRTLLPDDSIDVERVRYIYQTTVGGIGFGQGGFGGPPGFGGLPGTTVTVAYTLYRDDTVAQEFYEPPLYELQSQWPQTFSLSSEPPLSWDVDVPPVLPGTYEAVVLQSGAPFNPPTPTLLGIPDDFAWVLEWGALADLLGRQEEATDRERSAYAMKRYQDGLQLMVKTPWIELGKVNGQAVSIDSIVAMDRYSPEWDSNPTGFGPVIVAGGMDFIACPLNQGIGCTLLGNAPILDSTNTWVQISRSDADIMFFLAQSRAMFKSGGSSFKEALDLEKQAIQMCAAENVRLKSQGCFADILDQRGLQQERDMNRYNDLGEGKKRAFQRSHPEYF